MRKPRVKKKNDVVETVISTLNQHSEELIRTISMDTDLHRTQHSKHDANPVHYKADSDTRYADPNQKTGVCYVGFSAEVAIAESFQSGQGVENQTVASSAIEQSSLHLLRAARDLRVVDVAQLANLATHQKLRHLVQAKGQGRRGYKTTRKLSGACMQAGLEIDGLLYPSAVHTLSGQLSCCNLVLFADRGTQLKPVSHQPVLEVELAHGKTVMEFLEARGVRIE